MIKDPKETVHTIDNIRKELMLLWQDYIVNSADVFNKQATIRARNNLVKIGKLAKQYRELTIEFSKIPAKELSKISKELEQQKTIS